VYGGVDGTFLFPSANIKFPNNKLQIANYICFYITLRITLTSYVYTLVYVRLRLHSCTPISSFTSTYAYYLGLRLVPRSTPVTLMYALHLDVYTFRH
jgi:hypothetical protein